MNSSDKRYSIVEVKSVPHNESMSEFFGNAILTLGISAFEKPKDDQHITILDCETGRVATGVGLTAELATAKAIEDLQQPS